MFISFIGTWIQTIAQSWLVFALTQSAFLLGLVGFLGSLPIFLFSLYGGVVADRVNKRNLLMFTQTAFMALAFILALLTYLKMISPYQIILIALLNGAVGAFDMPTRQALVKELAGSEHLFNAIVLNSVAFNSSRVIGPALAGIFVAVIGLSGCFLINGISFLAAIAALFFIKLPGSPVRINAGHDAWGEVKEAFGFIKSNRQIFAAIIVAAVVSLFGVSYTILMPIFADEVLKVGVRGLGILMSCSGVGALLGALLLAKLGDFPHKGRVLFLAAFIFSISLMAFASSRSYGGSMAILVCMGSSSVSALAILNSMLQVKVPDALRGRVMSVFMLVLAGLMPFGNLISGSVSQILGAPAAVFLGGLLCTVFFIAVGLFFPEIRKI